MKKEPVTSAKFYALNSIDFTQTMFFVQSVQIGIALFSLPRLVSEEAGHSGWIAILIAGSITQLSVLILFVLARRFQDQDVYGIINRLFGRWVGNLLGFCFALYCILIAADVSRSYIEVVQQWLFPVSSKALFFLLLLMPITYCALGGARVLGRFAVLTFFATAWMVLFLIVPLQEIHTDYYQPVFEFEWSGLMRATYKVSASMVGFELMLAIYPFIQNKKKALLATSIGIWSTTLLYLVVVLIAVGFYSQDQIKNIVSPTLTLFKIITLPLAERIEHFGISTWSFLIVSTAATYLWAAGRFVTQLKRWNPAFSTLIFVPLLFLLGVYPRDMQMLTKFEEIGAMIGCVVSLFFPLFLLLVAILFRKRAERRQQEEDSKGVEAS
ncbi:GerAB/ArcD/ProY family transporter [Tumebacillus lipolyticus]|uniref:GerAB/ArcD/ProY family transporter n=1 Tax=Tumebacillus lipolyticus TaxID=1280370 RepID=A0ABW4ZWW5_9BACL